VETTEGKPTVRERLGRPSTVLGTAPRGASAPRTPPAAAGAPPPSDESAQEAPV
jgi:hypothetical protein